MYKMPTYIFNTVKVGNLAANELRKNNVNLMLHGLENYDSNIDNIAYHSSVDGIGLHPHMNNTLLDNIFRAYSLHIPLIIRPDDIWLTIILSFSKYVEYHAEEMRGVFVEHKGKKTLEIELPPIFEWKEAIELTSKEIDKHLKTEIKEWMEPGFSTTTDNDKIVSHIALMGSMKKYFTIKWVRYCGLSEVTLTGTLDDWIKIKEKIKRLKNFEQEVLNKWSEVLDDIIDEFICLYKGRPDEDFWQRICTIIGGGSGADSLNGWVLALSPFDERGGYYLNDLATIKRTNNYGKTNIEYSDIVAGATDVEVLFDDNGTERQLIIYGGLLQSTYADNKLHTSSTWIIIEKTKITMNMLAEAMIKRNKKFNKKAIHELYLCVKDLISKNNIPNQYWIQLAFDIIDHIKVTKRLTIDHLKNLVLDYAEICKKSNNKAYAEYIDLEK